MDDYRLGLTIEPTDNYKKALKDMLQMKASFGKLSNAEKDQLVREAFTIEIANMTPEQSQFLMMLMNMIQAR